MNQWMEASFQLHAYSAVARQMKINRTRPLSPGTRRLVGLGMFIQCQGTTLVSDCGP